MIYSFNIEKGRLCEPTFFCVLVNMCNTHVIHILQIYLKILKIFKHYSNSSHNFYC